MNMISWWSRGLLLVGQPGRGTARARHRRCAAVRPYVARLLVAEVRQGGRGRPGASRASALESARQPCPCGRVGPREGEWSMMGISARPGGDMAVERGVWCRAGWRRVRRSVPRGRPSRRISRAASTMRRWTGRRHAGLACAAASALRPPRTTRARAEQARPVRPRVMRARPEQSVSARVTALHWAIPTHLDSMRTRRSHTAANDGDQGA